jgi:hypothetical protein
LLKLVTREATTRYLSKSISHPSLTKKKKKKQNPRKKLQSNHFKKRNAKRKIYTSVHKRPSTGAFYYPPRDPQRTLPKDERGFTVCSVPDPGRAVATSSPGSGSSRPPDTRSDTSNHRNTLSEPRIGSMHQKNTRSAPPKKKGEKREEGRPRR